MRKNSPQNQTHKGADKPTSPRLTLRFQSIRSRDDKTSNNSKVHDLTSAQSKYPAYCVTMESNEDVNDFSNIENVTASQESAPPLESEDTESKSNTSGGNDVESSSRDSKTCSESTVNMDLVPQIDKTDTLEIRGVKINGGRLSSDSNPNKEREYASDTEKEESRCKRRKSSDNGQGRHNSVGHASSTKSHKSPSNRAVHQDSHSEQRSSPKGKKRGSLSSSETESNPSDSEMPDIAMSNSASLVSHNGNSSGTNVPSPKVPPLKIVIPSGSNSLELETRERNKVSSSKPALPYVVNTAETVEPPNSDVPISSAFISETSKDNGRSADSNTSKLREDAHHEERFQRVTRSSQRMQAAMLHTATILSASEMQQTSSISSNCCKTELSGESSNEDQTSVPTDVHPRKRKLRGRDNLQDFGPSNINQIPPTTSSNSFSTSDDTIQPINLQQQSLLLNSYQMYLNIRKQVIKKRKAMSVVHPKPPQGFKDYLLNRGSYVLEGNAAGRLSVPVIPPPQKLEGSFKDLFIQQEKERYRLRMQHLIEKEKLVLSAEQEILRVHCRAARAMANQTIPLSACSVLKEEEIYNVLDVDQDDKDKNVRSRYNGRLFLSWIQDVDDKWEKIKKAMLLRHHNEAESLHAVQKLDWEWKMKELAICDIKSTPVIDDISVPMVHVSDDFELLPA